MTVGVEPGCKKSKLLPLSENSPLLDLNPDFRRQKESEEYRGGITDYVRSGAKMDILDTEGRV